MKDYYDLWRLLRLTHFDKKVLADAIRQTFVNRGTDLELSPIGLTREFADDPDKKRQWRAFLKRHELESDLELERIVSDLAEYLYPFIKAAGKGVK